jgi:hypothetical protein
MLGEAMRHDEAQMCSRGSVERDVKYIRIGMHSISGTSASSAYCQMSKGLRIIFSFLPTLPMNKNGLS